MQEHRPFGNPANYIYMIFGWGGVGLRVIHISADHPQPHPFITLHLFLDTGSHSFKIHLHDASYHGYIVFVQQGALGFIFVLLAMLVFRVHRVSEHDHGHDKGKTVTYAMV